MDSVSILGARTGQERGQDARLSSFIGAVVLSDMVKTTLGPRGMDKILHSASSGELQVTNDGATILGAVPLDNPAAKVLVSMSKTQDDEVGDGTTSVCVLAGELLRRAERLVQRKVHPQTIIAGWRAAATVARAALEAAAVDHGDDAAALRTDLLCIARTTLSSKIVHQDMEHFATLAVDAVLRLRGSTNLDLIHIIKKQGGSIRDSFLADGFLLEKSIGVGQPKRIENAKILIANTAMDSDRSKLHGVKVRTDSTAQVAAVEDAERQKMLAKCRAIVDHGVNVFINRQLIYNLPEQFFADAGVMAIEHADFDGIDRLARVTGGEIVSTFDHPERVRLGTCKLIEEVMIGEDSLIRFSGVPQTEACTLVLRGATTHLLDEAERSLHDALCVLSQTAATETKTVLGGGCAEMLMAEAADSLARRTAGKQALAIDAFADALRQLPTILADNAGFDASAIVTELAATHHKAAEQGAPATAGIDFTTGGTGDMRALGVVESLKVKRSVLLGALEAAECILRIDDIITNPRRQRSQERY